jgi:hypothetical protein
VRTWHTTDTQTWRHDNIVVVVVVVGSSSRRRDKQTCFVICYTQQRQMMSYFFSISSYVFSFSFLLLVIMSKQGKLLVDRGRIFMRKTVHRTCCLFDFCPFLTKKINDSSYFFSSSVVCSSFYCSVHHHHHHHQLRTGRAGLQYIGIATYCTGVVAQ